MNHLDEGTIHAWLDGALDARQSADAEAHVARCAECSAKVAEARGLIAASSRILNALDDVPANVTPKRAPVAPVRRRFRASQWGYAAAAAVVIMVLWRSGDVRSPPPGIGPINIDAAVKAAMESIPPIAKIPEVSTTQPLSAPPPVVAQTRPAQPSRQAADIVLPGVSAGGAGGRGPAGVASSQLSRALPAPATTPVAADARSGERRFEARDMALADAMKKSETDPSDSWAGCYRIVSAPAVNRLEEVVVTSAPVANEARRRAQAGRAATAGAAAPAPAPAAAAAEKSSLTSAPSNASSLLVRLDSIAGQPGFTVRSAARSDSLVGVWRPLSRDSSRIAMIGRVPAVITKRDRVACPE